MSSAEKFRNIQRKPNAGMRNIKINTPPVLPLKIKIFQAELYKKTEKTNQNIPGIIPVPSLTSAIW